MSGVSDPSRVRVSGPVVGFCDGLVRELQVLGYATTSATELMRLAAHLSRWLQDSGLGLAELTPSVVDAFVAERRGSYVKLVSARALDPIIGYLRRMGEVPEPLPAAPATGARAVFEGFAGFLTDERALSGPVAVAYVHWVKPFVVEVLCPGDAPRDVTAAELVAFLARTLPALSPKSAQMTASALRSLLRFSHGRGWLTADLRAAVPPVARWRLAGLPQPLTPDQVRALLGACDPAAAVGCRDRAVIVLMQRLALRSAEVAALRLADLDWVGGTVLVRGKGGREDRMPLPIDVGEALVAYLRGGRPVTSQRTVFVRTVAPFTPLGSAASAASWAGPRAARVWERCTATVCGTPRRVKPSTLARPWTRSRSFCATTVSRAPSSTPRSTGPGWPRSPGPGPGHSPHVSSRVRPGSGWRGGLTMTNAPDLRTLIRDYLATRRALGFKLDGDGRLLFAFADHLAGFVAATGGAGTATGEHVTVEAALRFATVSPRASARSHALRLSAIRLFSRWAQLLDPRIEVPPARLLPARATRPTPFLYTDAQIGALLEAADELQPRIRAVTFRTRVSLQAATGIRTGEATGLDVDDVDVGHSGGGATLSVTGKYGKTRLLPLHPTVADALTGYLASRAELLPAAHCPALFNTRGARLGNGSVHPTFRAVADRAGLSAASTASRPRLHDLRHTFAVNTMLEAYRSGVDPAATLPLLATWLGHAEPADTYWYLTGTAELMAAATQRLDRTTSARRTDPDGEAADTTEEAHRAAGRS